MDNILILSASTGGGHNQVAKALTEEFKNKKYNVVKVEPFKEKSKALDFVISDGYKVLAKRMPKTFGRMYKISNKKIVSKPLSKAFIKTLDGLIYELVKKYEPVLIISTHPLIVDVVSELKRRGMIETPFISIVTDFIAHQSYINNFVDAYVVGSNQTKQSLVSKGILPERVYTYGIPLRREFLHMNKKQNPEDDFNILLMGGSMGVSGIKKAVKQLIECNMNMKLIVVCGSNEVIKNSIEQKYEEQIKEGRLVIYGFTKEVSRLMDNCDVIITKPGGLTTSESIAKRVPMIIPFFIPGQEAENAHVLQQEGGAIIVNELKQLSSVIINLMNDENKLNCMRESMTRLAKQQSLDEVMNLAESFIKNRNIESINKGV